MITMIDRDIYVAEPKFGGGNSTIIVNSDHVVVVDTQNSPAAAEALIREIKAISNKPVRYVINTHWHGDHHGGNKAFLQSYPGVKVIAHPNTIAGIESIANKEAVMMKDFFGMFVAAAKSDLAAGKDKFGTPLSEVQRDQVEQYIADEEAFLATLVEGFRYETPNLQVQDQYQIKDKNRTIEVRFGGRAHTDGDLYIYLPNEKILITGDLLTTPYVVPRSGYPRDYAKLLTTLSNLDFNVLVPGHGAPEEDDRLLLIMSDFMFKVSDYAQSKMKQGIGFEDAYGSAKQDKQLVAFRDKIKWDDPRGMKFLDFDRLLGMTLSQAYKELQP